MNNEPAVSYIHLLGQYTSIMDESDDIEGYDSPYKGWKDLDFSLIAMGMKSLPFFEDAAYQTI